METTNMDTFSKEMEALTAEDTKRMDWLSRSTITISIANHLGSPNGDGDIYVNGRSYRGKNLREVIDNAMKEIQ